MTTESMMREALEKLRSARTQMGRREDDVAEGWREALKFAEATISEALSPPARRTSYEWEFRELRYRCSWNGVDWSIYVFNPRLESWVWLPRAAAAAAIATLANLTPPEEEA